MQEVLDKVYSFKDVETHLIGKWVLLTNTTYPDREKVKIVKIENGKLRTVQVANIKGHIMPCKFSELSMPKHISDNDLKEFMADCEFADKEFSQKKNNGQMVTESEKRSWLYRMYKNMLYPEFWDVVAEKFEYNQNMSFREFINIVELVMRTQKEMKA